MENAGKALLSRFGVTPKTHQPAMHLQRLLDTVKLEDELKKKLSNVIPQFKALGFEEHFMTDYGDESARISPWEIVPRRFSSRSSGSCKTVFGLGFGHL